METPIVIFIYKRPEQTKALFEKIKQIRPKELFIFADGPSSEIEIDICNQTRKITEQLDWNPLVYRDYSTTNIGLSKRIISGLNYVFSIRERAIILEDDCIPNSTFFYFCEDLLEKYADSNRVMQISGTNLMFDGTHENKTSYFFSKFTLPNWGWATWSRAWKLFNPNFDTWKKNSIKLSSNLSSPLKSTWKSSFGSLSMGNQDSWDIQWMLDVWMCKGLCIIPSVNLITNIGVGEGASYMPIDSKYAFISNPEKKMKIANNLSNFILPNELILEAEVEKLLTDFIAFNRKNRPLSLTNQFVNFLQPKTSLESFKNLKELKEWILPAHEFTFLPESFFQSCLKVLPLIPNIKEGSWVQVGAWKGGCTAFFKFLMRDLAINQTLFIYDTFSNIPISNIKNKKDMAFIEYFSIGSNIPNYKQNVISLLEQFELETNVHFVEKDILLLNPNDLPETIAFACIDVDFYEPTNKILELIYPKLMIGGILLIDDYYSQFLNCKEAVDDFFETHSFYNEVKYEPLNSFTLQITRLK